MPEDEETQIPKNEHLKRLNAKNTKIEELQRQLAEAKKGEQEALTAAKLANPEKFEKRISRLMQERDGAREELEAFKTKAGTERAMLTAGITDADNQEMLMWRHSRLPEADRPSLEDWLTEGAKEDKQVGHLFTAEETPNPGLPNVNGKTKQSQGPPSGGSLKAVLAMSREQRASPEGRALVQAALDSHE